jgi:hypothetical protein
MSLSKDYVQTPAKPAPLTCWECAGTGFLPRTKPGPLAFCPACLGTGKNMTGQIRPSL